jgi:hypothetical protein
MGISSPLSGTSKLPAEEVKDTDQGTFQIGGSSLRLYYEVDGKIGQRTVLDELSGLQSPF